METGTKRKVKGMGTEIECKKDGNGAGTETRNNQIRIKLAENAK